MKDGYYIQGFLLDWSFMGIGEKYKGTYKNLKAARSGINSIVGGITMDNKKRARDNRKNSYGSSGIPALRVVRVRGGEINKTYPARKGSW